MSRNYFDRPEIPKGKDKWTMSPAQVTGRRPDPSVVKHDLEIRSERLIRAYEDQLPQLDREIALYKAASRTAETYKMWIVARQTNKSSLEYIGNPNYCSKDITCKAKTAQYRSMARVDENVLKKNDRTYSEAVNRRDAATRTEGDAKKLTIVSSSAGLVANPHILEDAYDRERHEKVKKTWDEFASEYLGAQGKEGYEVDMNPKSNHYGCLMKNKKWVHGDLDLFDVIMVDRFTGQAKNGHDIFPEKGSVNTYRSPTRLAGEKINNLLGTRMVHHGAHIIFKGFESEGLDVFAPDGRLFELPNIFSALQWFSLRWPDRKDKLEEKLKKSLVSR